MLTHKISSFSKEIDVAIQPIPIHGLIVVSPPVSFVPLNVASSYTKYKQIKDKM